MRERRRRFSYARTAIYQVIQDSAFVSLRKFIEPGIRPSPSRNALPHAQAHDGVRLPFGPTMRACTMGGR
jgi:hypothetical protein